MGEQNKRVTGKEQYYTPLSVAAECAAIMDQYAQGKLYLEPAGGTGSFVEVLASRGKVVSYDIEPRHPNIIYTDDFLQEEIRHLEGCITVTNPPFGRKNKLSIPFFNKCAEVSTHIGFLVPKSWRKWTVINRLDPYFHLVSDTEMFVDFNYTNLEEKRKGRLNIVFQVWEKRDYKRAFISVEDRRLVWRTSPEQADVALTAFGNSCGTVSTDFQRSKNTTKMYLKVGEPWVLQALKEIDYSVYYNNVAFVEALSIQEVQQLLNDYQDRGYSTK